MLGEASGAGTFANIVDRTTTLTVFGVECRFVDLDTLIHLKRAAGRPKDLERIAELEALRDERDG